MSWFVGELFSKHSLLYRNQQGCLPHVRARQQHWYCLKMSVDIDATSVVTVTKPKSKTTENWNQGFLSHVSSFKLGISGRLQRTQFICNGWHTPSEAKHADH